MKVPPVSSWLLPIRRGSALAMLAAVLGCSEALAMKADDWPEITLEERSLTQVPENPEVPAVVLISERNGRFGMTGVLVFDYHWRLKILTREGVRYGEIQIPATKFSRVSRIQARTIKSDGTIVTVDPAFITEQIVGQYLGFDVNESVIAFPAVAPGSILEYRYTRHDDSIFHETIFPWFFSEDLPTRIARHTQNMPPLEKSSIWCRQCAEGKTSTDGMEYVAELRNLPSLRNEIMRPPRVDILPNIDIATFENWDEVAARVAHFYLEMPKGGHLYGVKGVSPALRPVVASWTQGISGPEEKAKAILRHVQDDFEYVQTPIFVDSTPIDAILSSKRANSRDKAVLLLVALQVVGLDASPVLVCGRDSGTFNSKFFSPMQFSHAIVALQMPDGTTKWLDPTISHAPFGFLPSKDSRAPALLIRESATFEDGASLPMTKRMRGEVVYLPAEPQPSATRYRVGVKPESSGKADIEVAVEFLGEDAIDMRGNLVKAPEPARQTFLEIWIQRRMPDAALKSLTIENLGDPDKELRVKMSILSDGLVRRRSSELSVPSCIFGCVESNPTPGTNRLYPFYVGRAWNEEQTVFIQPPAGMRATSVPTQTLAKSAIGALISECRLQDNGSVLCSRAFVGQRGRWPATENAVVRSMYDAIVESDRRVVVFRSVED